MDEWIGLLALGPKSSGSSFGKADLNLLETIADQIAVALQNARLVESLLRVNNEFRRAYTAMEEAHSKLEDLDRTKSDFISITSHELRTPLTVISGYSQMLVEDPIYEENDFYHKVISGIHEGASRLHEIVESMLDVAKIDTRALKLKREPTDIKALLQQVYSKFREAFNQRNLVLTFDHLDDLPLVMGDPEELDKVFYHLISNAIKYTPDGGKISITGSEIPIGDTGIATGCVQIVVSDTGIGIDPRVKDLIFTKFYQTGELAVHSSGKTKFKGGGPGLGLAIVRGIVQAHGGRVWVESPGYDEEKLPGSRFYVLLPIEVGDSTSPGILQG
jgi:signal transduction histidine kinase